MRYRNTLSSCSSDAESAFHKLSRQLDDFVEKKEITDYTVKRKKIVQDYTSGIYFAKAKIKYKKHIH